MILRVGTDLEALPKPVINRARGKGRRAAY